MVPWFLRRTNHLLFMRDSLDVLIDPVINEMAKHFEWSDQERAAQEEELRRVIAENDLSALKGHQEG